MILLPRNNSIIVSADCGSVYLSTFFQKACHALDVLDAAEHQQVLQTWNDTAVDYPDDVCVHALFEAQVAARRIADAFWLGKAAVSD